MLDAIYYIGGTIAAIGSLYIAVWIWFFLRELPFLDRGDD
jgi:hypothetical protein